MNRENPPRMTERTFANPADLVPDPFTQLKKPDVHKGPLSSEADPFSDPNNLPPKKSR